MKKAKKVLALVLCAVLLVGVSVAGTVAYLTSQDVVTNSFTVGKVEITLDEAKVDEYGTVDGTTRVEANTYKLVPGHSYTKDPIIHVAEGSEPCYLFVKVDNGIATIEANPTIASQMAANGWLQMDNNGSVVYYKATAIDARNAAQDVAVFGTFEILDGADVSGFGDAKITVTAYAVQADGFASAQAAWDAAPASWN